MRVPFNRENRVSVFAALNCNVFMSWTSVEGTWSRKKFHNDFIGFLVPYSNPWPLINSIVVLDNAKINMLKELEDVVHQCRARLLFLYPCSPELSPIEVQFVMLKRWIQKHVNLVFPLFPALTLEVTMHVCTKENTLGLHGHCGCENG